MWSIQLLTTTSHRFRIVKPRGKKTASMLTFSSCKCSCLHQSQSLLVHDHFPVLYRVLNSSRITGSTDRTGARPLRAGSELNRQQLSHHPSLTHHSPIPSSDSSLGPSFRHLHHHSSFQVFPENRLSYPLICHQPRYLH